MKKALVFLGVLLAFFGLFTVMTYPLVFTFTKAMPGFYSSDESFTNLWDSWRIAYSLHHGISLRFSDMLMYPKGYYPYASGYVSYLLHGWLILLAALASPVAARNIMVCLNMVSSGVVVYFLMFRLTRNAWAAFFSGAIYAMCPYQFVRMWQHLGLTFNQLIPLMLLAVVSFRENPGKKQFWMLSGAFLLLFSFDWIIMFMGGITFLCLAAYYWVRERKEKARSLNKVMLAFALAMVLLLPQFLPVVKNILFKSKTTTASAFNTYHRPFEDLFTQSAKPLSYLLPASTHPVFGSFTEQFIGTQLYGTSLTEHTLYLGWIPLVLAFFCARRWFSGKKEFWPGFFVVLAGTAWLFSQAPWWNVFGVKIPLPSSIAYKFFPMMRAYCRFGIVLMLAVSVLAGLQLSAILGAQRDKWRKGLVFLLLTAGALFEFWNYPPYKVIDVSAVPRAYYWLKAQPAGTVIAEYPLDLDGQNQMYLFYQTVHEKPMVNGAVPGTPEFGPFTKLSNLSDGNTTLALAGMGVKYALVHHYGYEKTELLDQAEELSRIPRNPMLKLVARYPAQSCPDKGIKCASESGIIDVYEIRGSK